MWWNVRPKPRRLLATRSSVVASTLAPVRAAKPDFFWLSDCNRPLTSISSRAAGFTGCSTRRGTCRRGRERMATRPRSPHGDLIGTELPQKPRLAPAGKHRRQHEDQYPQPFHRTGLLSWQSNSVRFLTVHGNCAPFRRACNSNRVAAARFCDSRVPESQDVLSGETVGATLVKGLALRAYSGIFVVGPSPIC